MVKQSGVELYAAIRDLRAGMARLAIQRKYGVAAAQAVSDARFQTRSLQAGDRGDPAGRSGRAGQAASHRDPDLPPPAGGARHDRGVL